MQTAREKKPKKRDKNGGVDRVVITHPNQTPTSRHQFRQRRLQSLADVEEESANASRDFFGGGGGGGDATQTPECRPRLVSVSSAVAVTDVFVQVRVKASEFRNAQNADGASINQTHRCPLGTHTHSQRELTCCLRGKKKRQLSGRHWPGPPASESSKVWSGRGFVT